MGDGTELSLRHAQARPTLEQLQQMQVWVQYLPPPRDSEVYLNEVAIVIFARLMRQAQTDLTSRLGREPSGDEWRQAVMALPQNEHVISTLKIVNDVLTRAGHGIFERISPVYGQTPETDGRVIAYKYRQVMAPEQARTAVEAYRRQYFPQSFRQQASLFDM